MPRSAVDILSNKASHPSPIRSIAHWPRRSGVGRWLAAPCDGQCSKGLSKMVPAMALSELSLSGTLALSMPRAAMRLTNCVYPAG